MNNVIRLDYTKAPPGYVVEEIPAIERASERDKRWRARCGGACADRWTAAEALSAAWTHYRNRTDPPGLTVETIAPDAWWVLGMAAMGKYESEHEARAAAWAWYDRRHALSLREEALGLGARLVPFAEYLALTDVAVEVSNQCCEPLELDDGRPLELSGVGAAILLLVHGSAG